jgi:hypothetical protein
MDGVHLAVELPLSSNLWMDESVLDVEVTRAPKFGSPELFLLAQYGSGDG